MRHLQDSCAHTQNSRDWHCCLLQSAAVPNMFLSTSHIITVSCYNTAFAHHSFSSAATAVHNHCLADILQCDTNSAINRQVDLPFSKLFLCCLSKCVL